MRNGAAVARTLRRRCESADVVPVCLQGLSSFDDDSAPPRTTSSWISRRMLGATWMEDYVAKANAGGIERVLV
jgi:hypothetical protein